MHERDVHFLHMTLADYLARTGTTLEAFGARLGVAHSTVQRWATGQSRPRSKAAMDTVSRVTGGAVTAADFFGEPAKATPGLAEAQAPFAAEALALGLDPDAIAAQALRKAIADEKARRWQEENREAIEAWNRHFEENDTPLAKYRMF